jgi:hypothetical protein
MCGREWLTAMIPEVKMVKTKKVLLFHHAVVGALFSGESFVFWP